MDRTKSIIKVFTIMISRIDSNINSWSDGYKTGLEHALLVIQDKPILNQHNKKKD